MKRLLLWLVTGLVALSCVGESEEVVEADPARREAGSQSLSLYVVNYPLHYFAERIAGDEARVVFPAPPNGDPAYWKPDPEAVAAYQDADLILLNGAGYAKWVDLVSLPRAKVVDTSASFRDQYLPLEEGPVHTHGPAGEHSHTGYAFTTWLDPTLAIEQARAIAEALTGVRPEREEAFGEALTELEADLTTLDQRLARARSSMAEEPVLFSHPVYQYFERRYEIDGRSVHWEPDAQPAEEDWRELQELLDQQPARWMIWEDEPLEATRARLEQMGVSSLVFHPVANPPVSGDLLTAMTASAETLEAAFQAVQRTR